MMNEIIEGSFVYFLKFSVSFLLIHLYSKNTYSRNVLIIFFKFFF